MAAVALTLALGSSEALAQRALGVDVSNYQGSGINWSSVKGSGISFAWVLASEGTTFKDSDFAGDMNNGKAAGVYMGAYDFARPDLNTPGAEAAYFWSVAGSYIKADGLTFMPMLDMETFNGAQGASSYSDWANQWCQDIVADAAAAGVKIKPVIYMSACATTYFNSGIAGWYPDIANYNGESAQSGSPWNSTGCTPNELWGSGAWTVWQYSSSVSVSGISGGVDVDVYNGSASQLASAMVATSATMPIIGGDYDGDGVPDAVKFVPNTGTWSVRFSSNPNYIHTFQFGQTGDIGLVNGDFDGDGMPDSVLFRRSNATWYVRFSSDASIHNFGFGDSTDTPLLGGDFDGDGQPDAVLFRPSTATWYVRFSKDGSVHSFGFGESTDIPLLKGDWDGDGMPDAVLFRPSTGTWYVRYSKDQSVHSFQFGQSGDIPIIGGDYDGDGQPDAVIFNPTTATWSVRFSKDASVHTFGFGNNGDVPMVKGDWNGDGEPDSVLYRPSNNTWYVRFSSDASVHSFSF